MSSDSESGIMITPTRATRRQTRGGNGPKKSKHILSSTSKYFILQNSQFKLFRSQNLSLENNFLIEI